MLIRRLASGACFCALLLASPAQAAPGWLPPQDLSVPGQNAIEAQVALDSTGNAMAVWSRGNGTHTIMQAAFRPAGGPWQLPAQDLSAPGASAFVPQVAFDRAGNAIAVWHRFEGIHTIVQAAFRPAGGSWQLPAQDLSAPAGSATAAQVAVDNAGNAIAVWHRSNGSNTIVQAAFRPAGGPWQLPAQDLSASGQNASESQVALDPAGNAVAVWTRFDSFNYIAQGAVRPAGGPWQLAQDLSVAGRNASDPQVALDSAGNAVAAWRRFNGTNTIVQAVARPSGGPWGLPQDVSPLGEDGLYPRLKTDAAGNAHLVWQKSSGTSQIKGASRSPGGSWEAAQELSAPGQHALEPDVAIEAGGTAVAAWHRFDGANYFAQAAARPPGGPWRLPAQSLSSSGQDASGLQAALDPAGNALVVWRRSNGSNLIVQAAPYDATAPEARDLRVPARGFARQRLSFSVSPFDTWSATSPPVWSFGDGKQATGTTVTHRYAKRGTYAVTVTLADALANASSATNQLVLRTVRCFGKAATIVGTSGPDRIRGTRRADVIVTLGGNDRVRGRGGKDRICGGKGRDRLAGGAGDDRINGGPGRDVCSQGKGRGRLVSC